MKLIPFILVFFSLACSAQQQIPDQSIQQDFPFELEKYLGTWYEIARFDHRFERDLEYVTASYSLNEDGSIRVLNQGVKNGKKKKAQGKARRAKTGSDRNLEVSFFLNFYSPYNILELDEHYQMVLIGSNSPNYLWILSRTPVINETQLNRMLEKASQRGYDIKKLIYVEQLQP